MKTRNGMTKMITKIKEWLKVDNDIWSLRLFKLAFIILFAVMFLCFCGYDREDPVFLFFMGAFTLDVAILLATIQIVCNEQRQ